ncbi:MAG TPA: thioredoxin domain-containing protein [Solirubrobacteraceae bacterium]|nr:thioredoxin domain-containing protein [Solirubrobacteraceae bacterium]
MRELTSAPVPPPAPDDHVRGAAGAPLVIVFADFTCPRCALTAVRLREAPVRTCYRHFVLRARNRRALPSALAAEAAGRQGAFWAFHDALFADQGRLEDPHLWALVERLGLDLDRFEADRRDRSLRERVERDTAQALRAGAATTPALLVAGELHQGAPTSEFLAAAGRPG